MVDLAPTAASPAGPLRLTPLGRRLAALPLHPRLGRLLLAGAEAGLLREAATLAALLSEADIFADGAQPRRRAAAIEGDSDLLERLDRLEQARHSPELDPAAVRGVERVRDELLRLARRLGLDGKGAARPSVEPAGRRRALLRLILHAYPDRVTLRRAGDCARGVMVGGRGIVLEPASVVRRAPLFLSLDPRDGEPGAGESRVSLASAIERDWLAELFPHLTRQVDTHRFDPERGKVLTVRQVVFCELVVDEVITGQTRDRAGAEEALFEHLRRDAAAFFAADEEAVRWLARARFLGRIMPELALPAWDEETLAAALREACGGCVSAEQVRSGKRLRHALERILTGAQRAALAAQAPETLAVPSGSQLRLQYPDDGAGSPFLAVRLQEVFGLAQTPRLAAGRVPLVLHLLGPNGRPVQVTSDLRSFWDGAYREVRRDLRARYPKHPWPEDPWNAPAVAVGRRRR